MKKRIWMALVTVVVAGICAASVLAAKSVPTTVQVGNLVLTVDGDIEPKVLPRHQFAPIGFHASGKLAALDHSHPPAWESGWFDIDRDVRIDTSEFPACPKGRLVAQSTTNAVRACPGAILGRGKGEVEVAFPEQPRIHATGPILLFNGGEHGGVTTLYAHTYVSIPAPTAIVVTSTVRAERDRPYGTRIETDVPRIAGGAGSITGFELRGYRYSSFRGKRRSWLFARCPDGRFDARGRIDFGDGTVMAATIVRTCTADD